VLGQVEAINDLGRVVDVPPTCKSLLAVLLTEINQRVDKTVLLEIWDKTPSVNRLEHTVGELRALLEAEFGEQIALPKRRDGRVGLKVADPAVVDYERFRRQVTEASSLGDEPALALLVAAIEEFRGSPLQGLEDAFAGRCVRNVRVDLDEQYRKACHQHLWRLSAVGRQRDSLELAIAYNRRWPGDEPLFQFKIGALLANGRRADARTELAEFSAAHGASSELRHLLHTVVDLGTQDHAVPKSSAPQLARASEVSPELRKLRELSSVLAEDLDVVGFTPEGGKRRLSDGLYVERTRHTRDVLDLVTEPGEDRALIVGDPGYGKSSLQWRLYHRLRDHPGVEPLLVNSAWLVSSSALAAPGERVVTADQVVQGAEAIRSAGDVPVVLLDTADLLLHSNEDRLAAIDLCSRLEAAEARIVIACRPAEAELLPRERRRRFDLHYYDDRELAVAVTGHAQVYCPDAAPRDPAARVARIMSAVARSLPVLEVCRSPLHLRMLFELYDDEFLENELDVSGLYDKYRLHKVKTDQRIEVGYATGDDLSIATEQFAVALLARGRSELSKEDLLHEARTVRAGWPEESSVSLDDALEHLMRRGVLQRAGKVIRFNHQTLFEYFAGWGLISRDGQHSTDRLVEHMCAHPADLFAGAVLEQVLVLLAQESRHAASVRASLDILLAEDARSVRGIGLMVLARHPQLKELPHDLLSTFEPMTVRRYVQAVPTVVQRKLSELFAQLRAVWDMNNDECRQAVLEALERLASQAPVQVVQLLQDVNCADHVIHGRPDIFPTHHELPRIYAAIAATDPEYAGQQLVLFYREATERAHGRDLCVAILRLVARSWEHIHTPKLLATFRDLVHTGQQGRDRDASMVREAFGQLMAAQWWLDDAISPHLDGQGDEHPWLVNVHRVREQVELDDEDTIAAAELVGVAYVLTRLEAGHPLIEPTLDVLLEMKPPRAPYQLSRSPFPLLLRHGGPAADVLAHRITGMLESLPAPANKPRPGAEMWASIARAALNNAALSPDRVADLLANVSTASDTELWLSPDGLVAFLVPAAIGGHPTALRTVELLQTKSERLDPKPRGLVSSAIRAHLAAAPQLFPLLVALSQEPSETKQITEAIKAEGSSAHRVLSEHAESLLPMIDRMLGGNGGQQRDGVNLWSAVEQAGHYFQRSRDQLTASVQLITDPRAKANMLTLLGGWVQRGAVPFEQARTLVSSYIAIAGEPPALTATDCAQDVKVRAAARDALIQILATRADPVRGDVKRIRELARATPTDGGVFALAGKAATRLAESGRPREAAELVLALVTDAIALGQSGNVVEKLANRLRTPVVLVFRKARLIDKQWLLSQVLHLQPTLGRIVVNSAAQESFDDLEFDLRELSLQPLPSQVAKQIDRDLEFRSRTSGTTELPELAELYSAPEP